jgi:hypothetical protein
MARSAEPSRLIYTLVQTATLNGVDQQACLADILARIANTPQTPARRTVEVGSETCS